MTLPITTRQAWGATPWQGTVHARPLTEVEHFTVHYHGSTPTHDRGAAMAREVEHIHLRNGWSGIGYSFLVGQDGGALEGRGWNLTTAACPGINRTGVHVYLPLGPDGEPTQAALAMVRALYDETVRLKRLTQPAAQVRLERCYHSKHYATGCPGDLLRGWVDDGMPVERELQLPAPRPQAPVASRSSSRQVGLEVDGILGGRTVEALQRALGFRGKAVDGVMLVRDRKGRNVPTNTVRRLQARVGMPKGAQDGLLGPVTRLAVQRHLGVAQDGVWGRLTIKALQRRLNAGTL